MNVTGVLVRARPERFQEVLGALGIIPGVEVHLAEEAGGKIVVTVEDGEGFNVEASLLKLQLVDGISDASLVYQYSDDESAQTSSESKESEK